MRLLGLGFLAFFISISTQIHGLIGDQGILPASEYLGVFAKDEAAAGWLRYLAAPSLFWFGTGRTFLNVYCAAGGIATILLVLNIFPRAALLLNWALYLSFAAVARNFSGFQSDGLLLESAFLGLFLAPPGFRPGLGMHFPPGRAVLWMFRWFLFRLMFESGMVKLLSGDPGWRHLTALTDYYENCPFPTLLGYYVHQLPAAFHYAGAFFTLAVELAVAPLVLLVRPLRLTAFVFWTALQLGITLTANYTYLGMNAIAIGLLLVDDGVWGALGLRLSVVAAATAGHAARVLDRIRSVAVNALFAFIFYVTLLPFLGIAGVPVAEWPRSLLEPLVYAEPFRSANAYGFFAIMTHDRPQIEFEGSADGVNWKPYPFKWQPQDESVAPRWMAPHLPRFDWNLWFAALSSPERYPLVFRTGHRLLAGSPDVVALFAHDPFAGDPPRMIRFVRYNLSFTDLDELRSTGRYWHKERTGYYGPSMARMPKEIPAEGAGI